MTDNELRRLWRQQTAGAHNADLLRGLDDAASTGEREAAVAALAEDSRLADLGRVVVALRADADRLAADLARQRRPPLATRRWRPVLGFALAASAALLAVLALPRPDAGNELAPTSAAEPLFVGSFDGPARNDHPAQPADAQSSAPLFSGGFDS